MKFGKLSDVSGVDFSLPPDPPENTKILGGVAHAEYTRLRVGLPRWASKAWLGPLFPPKTPAHEFLHHYAKYFSCIELNSTHYAIPELSTVKGWREKVPSHFRFCPKIPQYISHDAQLMARDAILHFCRSIAHFEDQLGASFVQLPPHFDIEKRAKLAQFLGYWPSDFPLSIEFRHPSWFNQGALDPWLWELLRIHQVGAVVTDVAGRRDVLHTSLSNKTFMLRLVGNSLHTTDFERLHDWVLRIKHWYAQGLQDVYLFIHQPEDDETLNMGFHAHGLINQYFGTELPLQRRDDSGGQQMSLFAF